MRVEVELAAVAPKVVGVQANVPLPPVGHVVRHGRSPVRQSAAVAKVIEVALVVVAFKPVKFWRVVEPSVWKLVE